MLVLLRTCVDETFLDHLDIPAFVDADFLSAQAKDFITITSVLELSIYSALVTTQDFTFTEFFILP